MQTCIKCICYRFIIMTYILPQECLLALRADVWTFTAINMWIQEKWFTERVSIMLHTYLIVELLYEVLTDTLKLWDNKTYTHHNMKYGVLQTKCRSPLTFHLLAVQCTACSNDDHMWSPVLDFLVCIYTWNRLAQSNQTPSGGVCRRTLWLSLRRSLLLPSLLTCLSMKIRPRPLQNAAVVCWMLKLYVKRCADIFRVSPK